MLAEFIRRQLIEAMGTCDEQRANIYVAIEEVAAMSVSSTTGISLTQGRPPKNAGNAKKLGTWS